LSGYTPLFSTLTAGTLCGKWPDIGLWPIVLSLSDRNGVVDVTPDYLSRVTGLPLEDVEACMGRFCEPDKYSRSQAEGGARLVLLDPHRAWGWRVVNHSRYREKARKAAYGAARTESGLDAERKRASREVPRSPDASRAVPLSDSNSNTDSNKKKNPDRRTACAVEPSEFVEIRREYPKRAGGQRWGDALKAFKRRVAEGDTPQTILAGVRRYAAFTQATGIERTERVQQAATFLGDNRGYLELWHPPPRAMSAVEQAREELRERINGSGTVVESATASGSGVGPLARVLR